MALRADRASSSCSSSALFWLSWPCLVMGVSTSLHCSMAHSFCKILTCFSSPSNSIPRIFHLVVRLRYFTSFSLSLLKMVCISSHTSPILIHTATANRQSFLNTRHRPHESQRSRYVRECLKTEECIMLSSNPTSRIGPGLRSITRAVHGFPQNLHNGLVARAESCWCSPT